MRDDLGLFRRLLQNRQKIAGKTHGTAQRNQCARQTRAGPYDLSEPKRASRATERKVLETYAVRFNARGAEGTRDRPTQRAAWPPCPFRTRSKSECRECRSAPQSPAPRRH